ncbi:hypothetical protein EVAR_95506_1 [Eumeta japonica]|uniref:Uncharacterized protein n=1 Tax=Eumeta variegata TaxID=151549 RepID=A0A4C1UIT1_EUMVA|nr:hypothetical protein EVAR_95506_1 [Eumeta japonica]
MGFSPPSSLLSHGENYKKKCIHRSLSAVATSEARAAISKQNVETLSIILPTHHESLYSEASFFFSLFCSTQQSVWGHLAAIFVSQVFASVLFSVRKIPLASLTIPL